MKCLVALLVFTSLVLITGEILLYAQKSGAPPYAVVGGVTGKWEFYGGSATETRPADAQKGASRQTHLLHFWDKFELTENSCAIGTGGSSVMLTSPILLLVTGLEIFRVRCLVRCPPTRRILFVSGTSPPRRNLDSGAPDGGDKAVLTESESRYVTPVSRGLEAELAECVALDSNRVDFQHCFEGMEAGDYRLRLEPLSPASRSASSVRLSWSGNGPASASVPPETRPGLYKLVQLNSEGQPVGQYAWCLVSSPARFAQNSAAFQSAVETTKKWSDDVDARTPRAVLRAYLDSMSRQEPGTE